MHHACTPLHVHLFHGCPQPSLCEAAGLCPVWWPDKHRLRRPRCLTRVHTGCEWSTVAGLAWIPLTALDWPAARRGLLVQVFWWHDKYRPRKPRYFNRVHTGYEWNKYNQTHYDHDNPPPKARAVLCML